MRLGLFMVFAFQIPLPPVDEKKKVIEDVDKDRRYAIDASIVRIMKSRKVLGHHQLVTECVEQLGRMFKVFLIILIIIPTYFIFITFFPRPQFGRCGFLHNQRTSLCSTSFCVLLIDEI